MIKRFIRLWNKYIDLNMTVGEVSKCFNAFLTPCSKETVLEKSIEFFSKRHAIVSQKTGHVQLSRGNRCLSYITFSAYWYPQIIEIEAQENNGKTLVEIKYKFKGPIFFIVFFASFKRETKKLYTFLDGSEYVTPPHQLSIVEKNMKRVSGVMSFLPFIMTVFLLGIIGLEGYSYTEFYFRMHSMIHDAPYVVFHDFKTNETKKIYDQNIAHRLWSAITVINRTQASHNSLRSCESIDSPCLGYAAFPVDIGDVEKFDWPIYVYKDGTTLWGLPADRRKYFHMPKFRDAVMKIIKERVSNQDGVKFHSYRIFLRQSGFSMIIPQGWREFKRGIPAIEKERAKYGAKMYVLNSQKNYRYQNIFGFAQLQTPPIKNELDKSIKTINGKLTYYDSVKYNRAKQNYYSFRRIINYDTSWFNIVYSTYTEELKPPKPLSNCGLPTDIVNSIKSFQIVKKD